MSNFSASCFALKSRIYASGVIAVVAVIAVALLVGARSRRESSPADSFTDARLAGLPLVFEPNVGQTDPQVKYMARGNGYTLFLTRTDAVFSFHSKPAANEISRRPVRSKGGSSALGTAAPPVLMSLAGGNTAAQIAPVNPLPGRSNYYLGNDPKKWQTEVPQYGRIAYNNVYPGIDLAYYGEKRRLEFDFIVAPGSNSGLIDLAFSGMQNLTTDPSGDLVIASTAGDVVLHKPVAYQQRNGKRETVDARFTLLAKNHVTFKLGNYDRTRELVIDPTVTFATYIGGSGEDEAYGIAVDSAGNSYVTGSTNSINFPGPLAAGPSFDVFVSKLSADGTTLLYSTLIGGNGDDFGFGVAVNSLGTFVVGNTASSNFPATVTLGGGGQDAFVAKLDVNSGAAVQVTRIGGTGTESGNAIAVDSTGNTYIGGQTDSTDFPTVSPLQATNAGTDDGFVAKLNPTGTALTYSTYLGGSSGDLVTGIGLDGSNNAYVTGITLSSNFPISSGVFQTSLKGTSDTAFVSALNASGSALIYSTYLGGSGTNDALAIAVDSAGEAYITGDTNSSDFPTANAVQTALKGASDVFITKLAADGSGILFSTYLGGTLDEEGTGIALDSFNDVYVTGRTLSTDYPTSGAAFQASLNGNSDAFVTELSNTGFTVYSSYLGGAGDENSVSSNPVLAPLGTVAVDTNSNAYLAGATNSTTGFPITVSVLQPANGGGLADGFVAKVSAAPADFSVAVSPASITTTSGQTTGAITVTVSSVNASFGNAVTLSCGGKPTDAACNFSAASVTPVSTAVTSSLTISTNGSTGNGMLTPPLGHSKFFYAMLLPFVGVALVGLGMGTGKKKMLGTVALSLVLMALIILPACGGSSSNGGGGGGGGGSTNTPAGTYTITLTGTAGSATHSVPLTLIVN